MNFKIYKTLAGKVRVKHQCPHCNEVIENEIAEAGFEDNCPTCGKLLIVPGKAHREKLQAELHAAAAERQARVQQASQEAAQAREESAQRKKELAEAAARAKQPSSDQVQAVSQMFAPAVTVPREAATQVSYPALQLYRTLFRVAGYLTMGLPLVIGSVLFWVAVWNRESLVEAVVSTLAACVVMFPFTLACFVSAELIQIVIDCRRDLAELVRQGSVTTRLHGSSVQSAPSPSGGKS